MFFVEDYFIYCIFMKDKVVKIELEEKEMDKESLELNIFLFLVFLCIISLGNLVSIVIKELDLVIIIEGLLLMKE